MKKVVVIGAGVGGLATAVKLARAGLDVTVLEAHVYPGGSAGTFFHQGFRFDAGATLAAGFYPNGPMELLAREAGIGQWPVTPESLAMRVTLPDGTKVDRWGDARRHAEYLRVFGDQSMKFWEWQEKTSAALWELAIRSPAWPPQSLTEWIRLAGDGAGWMMDGFPAHLNPGLLADAVRPVASYLRDATDKFRLFIDAQLLIAAQTTSQFANALYGAAALDLPRRGVVHVQGGIGTISDLLVQSIRNLGGEVYFRQEATKIRMEKGKPVAVETRRGGSFPAEIVVANLPPWNIAQLLQDPLPPKLRDLPNQPRDGWGAFMVYVGLDQAVLPEDFPLHQQVIIREPLGDGRSIFMSLSPQDDPLRAPAGRRALTISTHTDFAPWWDLFINDRYGYESSKMTYVDRMLQAASRVIPSIRDGAGLILPGTPVTFQRFTRRRWGWVGGFPQTSLFRAWGPRIAKNLWMVGDSIFPGQSIAAVALGGMRVAQSILEAVGGVRKDLLEFESQTL